jgi:pseudaminic acid cytidylyltransferase
MIGVAIQKLIASQSFTSVIVSTDSEEIAETAVKHGALVPFIRSEEIADDRTPTITVIRDAIKRVGIESDPGKVVFCAYPCIPLLPLDAIRAALTAIEKKTTGYVFPVIPFASPPQRALSMSDDGGLTPVNPEFEMQRTQDTPPLYHDAGQFYAATVRTWLTVDNIHTHGTGILLGRHSVVDIDDEADWEFAEKLQRITNGESHVK